MKTIKWVSWLLLVFLFSGCSSVSVYQDYDDSVRFSALKTFAWKEVEQPPTGNPRLDNDLIDERIREAVNLSLELKGFRMVAPENADFWVGYFIDYKQRIEGGSVSVGMARGRSGRYGSVGYNSGVSDYEEGAITIDLFDPADEKMIWRGVGKRRTYQGSNPDKITKKVNNVVSSILKKFPPK